MTTRYEDVSRFVDPSSFFSSLCQFSQSSNSNLNFKCMILRFEFCQQQSEIKGTLQFEDYYRFVGHLFFLEFLAIFP